MIRITRQTDYGIVLLTSMAQGPAGCSYTAPALAAETRLPLPMVSKILKILTRAEILQSQRGVKGGYSLARPPPEISVTEMVQALEGPIALTACVDSSVDHCELEGCCPSQANWQVINRAIHHVLDHLTLADMAAGHLASRVHCSTCTPIPAALPVGPSAM